MHARRASREWLLAWAFALGCAFAPAFAQHSASRAPDGKPGIGTRELGELLKFARAPKDGDAQLLAQLLELPRTLSVLQGSCEADYRARGLFALCADPSDSTLAELHAALRASARDVPAALAAGGAAARAFARAWLDARLRARAELFEAAPQEQREIELALALLRGAATSYGELSAAEADGLARRIDLAAARLRALLRDLEALRPGAASAASSAQAEEAQVERLLALAHEPDAERRAAGIEALGAEVLARTLAIQRYLFTTRFDAQALAQLAWRSGSESGAAQALEQARVHCPDLPYAGSVPASVERMRKTERRQRALEFALAGLAQDPLDEALCYLAAHEARIVASAAQTAALYDRYLLLRGIVFQDDRTWGKRALSAQEEEALQMLRDYQALRSGVGGTPAR